MEKKTYAEKRRPDEVHATVPQVLRAFWQSVKPRRWQAAFIVVSVVINSLIAVYVPVFYKQFFDTLTHATDKTQTVAILIRIILIVLALNGAEWIIWRTMDFTNIHFQSRVMADLKERSFRYLLDHSYTFFANRFTGSLVQRINRFARAFESLVDRIVFNIIPLGVRIIGVAIILWSVKPAITIIIVLWVFVFLTFNFFFARWKQKWDIERAEADTLSTAVLSDAITNHNTIQLFGGAEDESRYYHAVAQDQARITRFTWNLSGIIDGVQAALMILAEFFLFYFAIRYWERGTFTIGTFVLIQAYLFGLGGRLWDFSRVVRDFYESFADAKEMVEILETSHEIRDIPAARPLAVSVRAVQFRDVSFRFSKTRTVLKNFNLAIQGGEKVALVGPSGAGKSTVVRLLMRLYDVADGAILIDGQNVKDVTIDSLRASISLVPQDPILFHRTLLENIRYGRRDATDAGVQEAGRLAHCDEFISELPQGYNTYVGERGIKLSGGERQRIAIARAILKNAPILVLDEATSSLDSHSESLIQDALATLMEGKTTMVIAHRLSTIRKMDRIVVIDHGRVVEEGTHDELSLREGTIYHKLWTLQAGGFLADEAEG